MRLKPAGFHCEEKEQTELGKDSSVFLNWIFSGLDFFNLFFVSLYNLWIFIQIGGWKNEV